MAFHGPQPHLEATADVHAVLQKCEVGVTSAGGTSLRFALGHRNQVAILILSKGESPGLPLTRLRVGQGSAHSLRGAGERLLSELQAPGPGTTGQFDGYGLKAATGTH